MSATETLITCVVTTRVSWIGALARHVHGVARRSETEVKNYISCVLAWCGLRGGSEGGGLSSKSAKLRYLPRGTLRYQSSARLSMMHSYGLKFPQFRRAWRMLHRQGSCARIPVRIGTGGHEVRTCCFAHPPPQITSSAASYRELFRFDCRLMYG